MSSLDVGIDSHSREASVMGVPVALTVTGDVTTVCQSRKGEKYKMPSAC